MIASLAILSATLAVFADRGEERLEEQIERSILLGDPHVFVDAFLHGNLSFGIDPHEAFERVFFALARDWIAKARSLEDLQVRLSFLFAVLDVAEDVELSLFGITDHFLTEVWEPDLGGPDQDSGDRKVSPDDAFAYVKIPTFGGKSILNLALPEK